ncbi:MAG TPA: hypothetical protein VIJ07_07500 [Dermatophilaceae bacterium]
MPSPSEFEIKCTQEAEGIPWPDLTGIVFKAPVVVVQTRSCVRCTKPVEGDRCPACRAHQGTYLAAS